MVRQLFPILTRMLAAVVVVLGSALSCAGHGGGGHGGGGHGGGGGHALGGFGGGGCGGFHGGFGGFRGGFGYRGFGYPGWYGLGWGLGLGYGLGYGFGYPYYGYGGAYPFYGYPYGGAYPAYPGSAYGPPPTSPPSCPPAGQGPAPGATVRLTDTDVLLGIRVPPDAVVRINGEPTAQKGPRREFMSSGLLPGRTYTFVVTARWTGPNGQAVEREQRVRVQGGERRAVDFLAPPPPRDLPLVGRAGS